VPKAEVKDVHNLTIRTWVNSTLVQDSNTSQMVVRIPQLIAFLSQGTTLLPGTVICTGTPAGVGYVKDSYLRAGDIVRVEIEGLGVLRNPVAEEQDWGGIALN
jgi:2-keto-4-pentenoate hydratase/2-oxohepta-3-ene-1,7-dioic acid hydratase in catechol pathway